MKRIILIAVAILLGINAVAQETVCFVQRDTCDLYMDIWRADAGSVTAIDSLAKPTVMYVFGGGFIRGKRNDPFVIKWFKHLNSQGYSVVSIDYRLGMKGYKVGKGLSGAYKASEQFLKSQQMGVEDVFSAVSYLEAHPELGIDANNLVVSGSSAGAIISITGAPKFKQAPCPLLLFHGTADQAVAYKSFGAFGRGVWGSSYIAGKLQKKGWQCCIYRFTDRSHAVAAYMDFLWPYEEAFLEKVTVGADYNVDAEVDDKSLPSWFNISMKDIYK